MKMNRTLYRAIAKVLIGLVILVAAGAAVFVCMRAAGRNKLYQNVQGEIPVLHEVYSEEIKSLTEVQLNIWQEGDVRYQGKIYRYNEDILTFLILGIDEMGEVKKVKDGISGGQSDAVFLLILNPRSQEMSLIAINRDTVTDIDIYDKDSSYLSTVPAQLTLQHGYGDAMELSCERSVKAVSGLFYELPIHGYCAVNMGAVPLMNDAVGGVEVTVLEDLTKADAKLEKGDTVLLTGKSAYWYVKYRDTEIFNSAGSRLLRQKQYLSAYVSQAKKIMKHKMTLPVQLYNTVKKYTVTDVSIDEAAYLAGEALHYQFPDSNIYSLKGETVMGEEHEEFYADEQALYELILQVFYEEIE